MQFRQEKIILILHGWGRFTGSWFPVKQILENRGFSVFYPGLPGLDENQPLDKPWALNDYVDWVKQFTDKNNLSRFFLLGHSFGGRVAIKFAVKYPETLSGLILVSAAGIRSKKISKIYGFFARISKIVNKLSFIPGYDFCRKAAYRFLLKKTDYVTLKNQIMKDTFKNVIEQDLSDLLPQIQTKTLILWGDKDVTTPLADGDFMAKTIPNARLCVIPQAPHMVHVHAPNRVSQEILKFIANGN